MNSDGGLITRGSREVSDDGCKFIGCPGKDWGGQDVNGIMSMLE